MYFSIVGSSRSYMKCMHTFLYKKNQNMWNYPKALHPLMPSMLTMPSIWPILSKNAQWIQKMYPQNSSTFLTKKSLKIYYHIFLSYVLTKSDQKVLKNLVLLLSNLLTKVLKNLLPHLLSYVQKVTKKPVKIYCYFFLSYLQKWPKSPWKSITSFSKVLSKKWPKSPRK